MHALGQLIEDCKAVNRWSNGDIARQSKDRITRTRVQQLAKDPIKAMPTLRVVEGLALGLRVPGWVIVGAVLESMGYPTRPGRVSVDEAINSDPGLSESQRTALRAYLSGLRATREMEVVSDGKPQPRRQATQQAGSAPNTAAEDDDEDDLPAVLTEEWVRDHGWAAHVVPLGDVETSEDAPEPDIPPGD